MRFKIQANNFARRLGLVQGIAKQIAAMPILTHVLIIAKEDKIEICATDVENSMVIWCPADVIKQGSIVLPANKLFSIVKELLGGNSTHEGMIDIEEIDNDWVEVRGLTTLFKIAGLPTADFPMMPEMKAEILGTVKNSTMQSMIAKTIFAVSSDALRRNICGILFHCPGKSLRCVATDGQRMSIVEHCQETLEKNEQEILVPAKGITELRKMLKFGDNPVRIGMGDNFFMAESKGNGIRLMSRLIDDEFPNYAKVIPESSKVNIVIERREFVDALKRVSLLASGQARGIKFTLDEDGLTLVANSPDVGVAKELMLVDYSGETIEFGCNSRYLLDVLQVMTQDQVRLFLTDDHSPIVIKPELAGEQDTEHSKIATSIFGKESELYVVMPMRL